MKNRKIKIFVFLLVVVVALNSAIAVPTSIIDPTRKGSLTITTREQNNESTATTTAPVIQGVEYTLYRVDTVEGTTVTTLAQAETAISNIVATDTKTTGIDGVASFTNLDLGRYYVKVTGYPTGTSEIPESFLVNVPMTNAAGTEWIYDITTQPKVKTATGNLILTKQDEKNQPLQGVVFTVQISTKTGQTWSDWSNYIPEGASEVLELTTGVNGQVRLEDYPITYQEKEARFRLVEKSVPNSKFVINNAQLDYVYAQADGKTIVVHSDGTQESAATVGAITIVNDKPVVVKTVKTDDGTYDEQTSVSLTETISFRLTTDVPNVISDMTTFWVEDDLPDGLTGITNIAVTGINSNGTSEALPTTAYTQDLSGNSLQVWYEPTEIEDYSSVVVSYDAILDMDFVTLGATGNINTATLTYTNSINPAGGQVSTTTSTDTTTVLTGGIKIHKVDGLDASLQDAKFKIATSQANATAGTFVKGRDGYDIEVTSNTNGYATIDGLAYEDDGTARDYWLVETLAPTFTEDNETKSYTLLTAPVRVSVSGTSHTVDVKVINRKPFNLPLTGGIGTVAFIVVGAALLIIAKSIRKEAKE